MGIKQSLLAVSALVLLASSLANAAPTIEKPPIRIQLPDKGTIRGYVALASDEPDPTFAGTCADLTVIARSTAVAAPITTKGTGDIATKRCNFELDLPVGKWSVSFENGGKSMATVADKDLAKGQTLSWTPQVKWPTLPSGLLRVGVNMGSNATPCSGLIVRVIHAQKTYMLDASAVAGTGQCAASKQVLAGPVTVQLTGATSLPPQQVAIEANKPNDVSFSFPKNADVGVRLRPANHPAKQSPSIACGVYQIVIKKEGAVVLTKNVDAQNASDPYECVFGLGPNVPASVPLVLEVKKNGQVVKTDNVGPFAPLQHSTHVVQPLP